MHPVPTHSLWLQIWVARLSSVEKLHQSLLIQFLSKDRGKCIWKIKEMTSLSRTQAHVSAPSQAAITLTNSTPQTLQWGGRWENYCACPPALGWWIKTVTGTAENRDLFLGFSKPISCQCTGKPEWRPGKDSLRIIKYILAWYLHTGKPPVVCVPFREVTLLIFLKTEEFWELKTYAEGLYLIEFCWSRANTGAFATAFKICRDSWVICAPLKLHQQISVTAVCSSAVTNGVKQALIIFCQMKDIHCSLHW